MTSASQRVRDENIVKLHVMVVVFTHVHPDETILKLQFMVIVSNQAHHLSQSFPASCVDLRFQLPRHRRRNAITQPNIPIQLVIPLLIQKQLFLPPQSQVRLAIPIQIWRREPAAIAVVQHQDSTLPDVEEHADVATADFAVHQAAAFVGLSDAVLATTAARLAADESAAEEADGGVVEFASGGGTFAGHCFGVEHVVCGGKGDQGVGKWVAY